MLKERRKGYKAVTSGDLMQINAIAMFKDGIKGYIITAIGLTSKFGFAYGYSSLSSRSVKDFMSKLEYVCPFKIRSVKTDKVSEFEKEFDKLKDLG